MTWETEIEKRKRLDSERNGRLMSLGWDLTPVPRDDPRWGQLRAPFPPQQIGHKPQPWCRACSDDKRRRHCDNHQIKPCKVCRQRITEAHIDLDYVGHAAVTLRLLEVDPFWDWTPMLADEVKGYNFPSSGEDGMWIWLLVLGRVRPGLGETEGGQLRGANAVKARMSDAIKNGAQRFGVAIETWSKEDLSGNAEAAAELTDEVARAIGGVVPAAVPGEPTGRKWADEFKRAKTDKQLQNVAEQAKRAGELEGPVLAAAAARKKEIAAAEKAAEEAGSSE